MKKTFRYLGLSMRCDRKSLKTLTALTLLFSSGAIDAQENTIHQAKTGVTKWPILNTSRFLALVMKITVLWTKSSSESRNTAKNKANSEAS